MINLTPSMQDSAMANIVLREVVSKLDTNSILNCRLVDKRTKTFIDNFLKIEMEKLGTNPRSDQKLESTKSKYMEMIPFDSLENNMNAWKSQADHMQKNVVDQMEQSDEKDQITLSISEHRDFLEDQVVFFKSFKDCIQKGMPYYKKNNTTSKFNSFFNLITGLDLNTVDDIRKNYQQELEEEKRNLFASHISMRRIWDLFGGYDGFTSLPTMTQKLPRPSSIHEIHEQDRSYSNKVKSFPAARGIDDNGDNYFMILASNSKNEVYGQIFYHEKNSTQSWTSDPLDTQHSLPFSTKMSKKIIKDLDYIIDKGHPQKSKEDWVIVQEEEEPLWLLVRSSFDQLADLIKNGKNGDFTLIPWSHDKDKADC